MTSAPVRDSLADHLLASENAALLFIGYQLAPQPGSARWTARRCDNSPGRPATAHFRLAGHPVIRSYELAEDWYRCYLDQFVFELQGAPPAPSPP
jgi:hypothetical protein